MTDLTPAEERLAAWQTLPCRYAPCSQPTGRRCITSSGARTTPHAPRLYDIRAYLLGQATAATEVAGLTTQLAAAKAANDQLTAALGTADGKEQMALQRLANLQLDLTHAQADLAAAQTALAGRDTIIAQLNAKIAELTKPDPVPVPSKPPVILGACPAMPGGFSVKAAQTVLDRLGNGASVRLFGSTVASKAPRPAGAGRIVASYSHNSDVTVRPTATQWQTAVADLKDDGVDLVASYHEFDSKVRGKKYTLDAVTTALEYHLDTLAKVRPNLWTVAILTGWLFSPSSGSPGLVARNAYGPIVAKHNVLGVDLDGVHSWPYPNYLGHIGNIIAFMDKFGIEWFSTPELGWSRTTDPDDTVQPQDPTGSVRIKAYAELVDAMKATGRFIGAEAFWYDGVAGYNMLPAEDAAWKTLGKSIR